MAKQNNSISSRSMNWTSPRIKVATGCTPKSDEINPTFNLCFLAPAPDFYVYMYVCMYECMYSAYIMRVDYHKNEICDDFSLNAYK